jgi:hypothetical protein
MILEEVDSETIEAAEAYDLPGNFEIVVVAGASTPHQAEGAQLRAAARARRLSRHFRRRGQA